MQRVRRIKNTDYTTISNEILRNKNISLKAKALHVTIMGLPDNWDFSVMGIVSIVKEGKEAVYNAIDELIDAGYVQRQEIRDKGRFKGIEYVFNECLSGSEPYPGKPDAVKPDAVKPDAGNPLQSNKQLINYTFNQINKESENSPAADDFPQFPNSEHDTVGSIWRSIEVSQGILPNYANRRLAGLIKQFGNELTSAAIIELEETLKTRADGYSYLRKVLENRQTESEQQKVASLKIEKKPDYDYAEERRKHYELMEKQYA